MPLIPLEEYLQQRGDQIADQMFPGMRQQSPTSSANIQTAPGFFAGPTRRGMLSVGSDFSSVAGMASEAIGFDEYSEGWYEKAQEFAEARDVIPRRVPRVEDISNLKDVGVFAVETLLENAPLLASIAIPGGLAAKGAQLLGAGARASSATGAITAFLADVGLQTGESAEIAREAGADPLDVRVVGSGIAKGALDFIPLLTIAKRIGLLKNLPLGPLVERELGRWMVEGGFIARAAGEGLTIAAREIPTEMAQEGINIAINRIFRDYGGELTDEEKSQILNAGAGAAAFGLLGIPAAVGPSRVAQTGDFRQGLPQAVDEAELPQENVPLLAAPEQSPVWSVAPDGTVDTYTVPLSALNKSEGYDPIRTAVQQVLEGQPAPRAQGVLFTEDGTATANYGPDELTILAAGVQQIPAIAQSEIDRAILQIEGARQEGRKREVKEPSGVRELAAKPIVPSALQKMLNARDEILSNTELRRKRDGELNAKGKKQLDSIERRIEKAAETMGVQNPLATLAIEDSTNVEADLQEQVRAEETQRRAHLSPGEETMLYNLQEKETFEGLTAREEEQMSRLLEKQRGEDAATRERRTPQEIRKERKELESLARDIRADETVRRSELSDVLLNTEAGRTFRMKALKNRKGMTPEQVADIVAKLRAGFTNAPEVVIAPNSLELFGRDPNSPYRHMVDEFDNLQGFFSYLEPDRVYMFSDLMKSEQDVKNTLLHETLHRGIEKFMPPQEADELLRLVAKTHPEVRARVMRQIEGIPFADPGQRAQAIRRAAFYEAEEIIAETAESNPQDRFLDRAVSIIRRALRKVLPGLRVSDAEIRQVIANVGAYGRNLRSVTPRNQSRFGQHLSRARFLRDSGRQQEILQEVIPDINSLASVWGQRLANGVLTPLQIAKGADNVVPSAKNYLERVQQWWARKRELTEIPVDITEDWSKFSKRDSERIAKTIFMVNIESERLGRKLDMDEVKAIMKRSGLDPDKRPAAPRLPGQQPGRNAYEIWRDVDASMTDVLNNMEQGLQRTALLQATKSQLETERLWKLWTADPAHKPFMEDVAKGKWKNFELGSRLANIENQINFLRETNYFPRMRFGKWGVTIRAQEDMIFDGREVKAGGVVLFETHAKPGQARTRAAELGEQKFGDKGQFRIELNKLSDTEFSFLGMPPALFDILANDPNLGLNGAQQEALKQLYFKHAPGQSFLRHLVRREGIAGFSTDAQRVFASYAMNAANHIARVEFHEQLNNDLSAIREESRLAQDQQRAGLVKDYFEKHYNYIMTPKNDLARIRAMGFLWYLGFNVKSAFVNLTQVPMVAFPYLSSVYGEKSAMPAIAAAYRDVSKMYTGRKVFDADLDAALKRGVREGFIDESAATELAAVAEGGILQTVLPEGKGARLFNKTSYYGAAMFRHAEKYNRMVTFVAGWNLAKQRGLRDEALFKSARDVVQTTMFEYAKWNRPEFMRGKKSVFFLFWQYMQHLAFIAYGGEGKSAAIRTWMMLMAAAGAQGLPFAENFFDIFDWTATEVKEQLGVADPRTAIRDDLREFVGQLIDEPDYFMHGMSRYYGLGPMHFLSLLDVPVPNVDISGSLGTGEILPGLTEALRASDNPDEKIGRVMVDVLGPVVATGYNLFRALEDDNPDNWKKWERAMPTVAQGVSKAFRRSSEGQESFRGGGAVIKYEPGNALHQAENIMQAFGFAPTRLNQRQELRFSQEQMRNYWVLRKATLLENLAYAVMSEDSEGIDRANRAIRNYNRTLPAPQLGINAETITRSIKQRYRHRFLREAGIPAADAFVPLYRRTEQLFPGGSGAIPR